MESLDKLEANLKQLLKRYQDTAQALNAAQLEVERQHDEIIAAHAEIQRLKHELRDLQTAHSILQEKQPLTRERARVYLNQIIAQVDEAMDALRK